MIAASSHQAEGLREEESCPEGVPLGQTGCFPVLLQNVRPANVRMSNCPQGQIEVPMSKSDRRIDIEEINGVTVARLLEKKILDEANIEALGQELFALVDKDGRKKIVLDFSQVEYLSSAALGKLITMHKKTTTAKGKLALCKIQKDILDVFKITQLNKVLTLCTDLDEALSKF
jgi:anti-sigma B factor antagonist